MDKQSLLDSGILCCLVHILNVLLGSCGKIVGPIGSRCNKTAPRDCETDAGGDCARQLEVSFLFAYLLPFVVILIYSLSL